MAKRNFKFDWPLVGNTKIVEYWEKRILSGQEMSGTLVFSGPDNLGKTSLAKHLAQILLCDNYRLGEGHLPCGDCPSCRAFKSTGTDDKDDAESALAHGDCNILKRPKEKKEIPVEAVRDFIRILSMSSFLGRAKVGIIKNAEHLSVEAANALLKTLEEPRPDVTIILSCRNVETLPRTILSRSQVFNFRPVHPDRIYEHLITVRGVGRGQARDLSRLAQGRPALAVKFLEDKEALDKRLTQAIALAEAPGLDLNERLAKISSLLPNETVGQEGSRVATKILLSWQSVVRDWLLLEYGLDDRVQHQALLDKLKQNKHHLSSARLLSLARCLDEAVSQVMANVNPRLALEGVMISL